MMPDLRFLLFLNAALIAIGGVALFKLITVPAPKPNLTELVDRVKKASYIEQAIEEAGFIAKLATKRAERIFEERRFSAIICGFGAFVGATNLFYFVILYRKTKNGAYFQNGVELTKE